MLTFIEVPSHHVDEFNGVAKGPGRAFSIRKQEAYIFNGGAYPERFDLPLDDRQAGYEPGRYLIAQGSYERDRANGNAFKMARSWKLIPLAEASTKLNELMGAAKSPVARAA